MVRCVRSFPVCVVAAALLVGAASPAPVVRAGAPARGRIAAETPYRAYLPAAARLGPWLSPPLRAWHPLAQVGGVIDAAAIHGVTAFAGVGARVVALDLSDADAPRVLGAGPLLLDVVVQIVAGPGRAYAVSEAGTLQVLDTADPTGLVELARADLLSPTASLALDGDRLFVPTAAGIAVVDVGDLELEPLPVRYVPADPGARIAAAGGRLFVLAGTRVRRIDLDAGSSTAGYLPGSPNRIDAVVATGDRLYVAREGKLLVLDAMGAAAPRVVTSEDRFCANLYSDGAWLVCNQTYAVEELVYQTLLEALSLADPDHPRLVTTMTNGDDGESWRLVAAGVGRALWRPDDANHVPAQVLDTSALPALRRAGRVPGLSEPAYRVVSLGDVAYVRGLDGWRISDLRAPTRAVDHGPLPSSEADSGNGISLRMGNWLYNELWTDSRRSAIDVLDLSEPLTPTVVASFLAPYGGGGFKPTGGVRAEVTAMAGDGRYLLLGTRDLEAGQARLELMDVRDPVQPRHIGGVDLADSPYALAHAGDYAYAGVENQIVVVDRADSASPRVVGQVPAGGDILDLQVSGERLFAVAGRQWATYLVALDISRPTTPRLLGRTLAGINWMTDKSARTLVVRGDLALVGARWLGVDVVDVSDPSYLRRIARLPAPGNVIDMALFGDQLYAAAVEGGLVVQTLAGLGTTWP